MDWNIAYAHHEVCKEKNPCTIEELKQSEFDIIPACVPGNFELDLMRAGRLEDLYYSTNTQKAQELEDVHVWYFATVNITNPNQYLHFAGIDTFSDIYVNGSLVKSTDNMNLEYDVFPDWIIGENELVVHIRPTMLEARKFTPPAGCYSLKYNMPSLYVRKAAHMFGWDIMPRIVSAGIWREVEIRERKADRINEVYLVTHEIGCRNEGYSAKLRLYVNADLSGAIAQEYTVRIEGRCGAFSFSHEEKLWHNTHACCFDVDQCALWWPKHAGKPNLYDVTVTLLRNGQVCDTYEFKYGIRKVELRRTEYTENRSGEFCFYINGKRIFALGTNWVPLDAFHSNDPNHLPKALELLDDIGCNFVRCWGGNVYESDAFYDYCDAHGILIWQDFAMGCAIYPDEEFLQKKLHEEAVFQIKRLRNHPALALWAGDNECDVAQEWLGFGGDPNQNSLTRKVLRRAVELHDYSRPYLPSSPYVSLEVYRGKGEMPENHLWGPRDYFKGDFYRNTFCHFASETGYHGFPAPQSLKRFLKNPEQIFDGENKPTDEYLVHAASMDTGMEEPYAYRIKLAYDQVVTLFGTAEPELNDFVRQSQISQAEAKKYFIEKFRIGKWERTGIMWWNLLDGWPQVSDAVVDYYYRKKLAYHYIKRLQEPVCLMFDEPKNGVLHLIGVNDLPTNQKVQYKVSRIDGDATAEVLRGEAYLVADSSAEIGGIPVSDTEKTFYLIEWMRDGKPYKNHYFTNIINIDYRKYLRALEVCGMDEFEGLEED